jgi:D-inositol-3-phosphate glycosyltransferase
MRERNVDVEFAGPQPHDEIGNWFQAADVVVVPSLNEPFGLVIIEALAAGTPVIASNVDDIPTIVRDRENGLLVPANDPTALANAIETIANDRELLQAMQENARPSVWPRFSWEESGRLLRDAVRARLRDNR